MSRLTSCHPTQFCTAFNVPLLAILSFLRFLCCKIKSNVGLLNTVFEVRFECCGKRSCNKYGDCETK